MSDPEDSDKTLRQRKKQFEDRWSSLKLNPGIQAISNKLSPEQLEKIPIFHGYSTKFLEKISPDVALVKWEKDALLFEEGNYIDLAFYIITGTVDITLARVAGNSAKQPQTSSPSLPAMSLDETIGPAEGTVIFDLVNKAKETHRRSRTQITMLSSMDFNLDRGAVHPLGPGELFGEIGALSGWPQPVTARTKSTCSLVHIRLPALRMMKNKSTQLKQELDRRYRERALLAQLRMTPLFSGLPEDYLQKLADQVELVSLTPREVLTRQGQKADAFYLVRSGFIKLMQHYGTSDMVVSYLAKGQTLGEIELLIEELPGWETTAASVEYAELIKIPAQTFLQILEITPELKELVWKQASKRIRAIGFSKRQLGHANFMQTALDLGLVEGTSILAIDLETCTRCDDCVRGCAATHGGRPRFIREGHKLGNMLIPKSCYHCKDPVCLIGCPTGAIHRAGTAEVITIEGDICIGCGTCANNCPYDAIVMHSMQETWPEDMVPAALRGTQRLLASKCDLCVATHHEPACVSNCPQGCAVRLSSLEEFEQAFKGGQP